MNLFEMLFRFRVARVDSFFFPLYGVYAKSGKEGNRVILKWKIALCFFFLFFFFWFVYFQRSVSCWTADVNIC